MNSWLICVAIASLVVYSSANSSTDISYCLVNEDCATDRVCANTRCVNPCAGVCGDHTMCHVTNHVAMCSCSPGYVGHPALGCSMAPPIVKPECTANEDCESGQVCAKLRCVNPCVGLCAVNTECNVANHVAICTCSPGYSGHPLTNCSLTQERNQKSCLLGLGERLVKKYSLAENQTRVTWNEAKDICKREGKVLATIKNEEEQRLFELTLKSEGILTTWIGLTDIQEQGSWRWIDDNSSLEDTGYSNWKPNEPNNAVYSHDNVEHCTQVNAEHDLWNDYMGDKEYQWNDIPCGKTIITEDIKPYRTAYLGQAVCHYLECESE